MTRIRRHFSRPNFARSCAWTWPERRQARRMIRPPCGACNLSRPVLPLPKHFVHSTSARVALSNAISNVSKTLPVGQWGLDSAEQPNGLLAAYSQRRANFSTAYARAVATGALSATDLSPYLREDPAANLSRDSSGSVWRPAPVRDSHWAEINRPKNLNDTTFVWNDGAWLGRGEPTANRSIEIVARDDGTKAIRFEHVNSEHLSQWIPTEPGARYRASVEFRGRVAPGDEEYLIVSFIDRSGGYLGGAAEARVPPGNWPQPRHLEVTTSVPRTAAFLGIAIYSCHQLGSDYAEFEKLAVAIAASQRMPGA